MLAPGGVGLLENYFSWIIRVNGDILERPIPSFCEIRPAAGQALADEIIGGTVEIGTEEEV